MSNIPANQEGFDRDKQARYERLFDLLADQALFGLEPVEQFELEQLLDEFPDVRADELEATTAAIHAAHVAAEQAQSEANLDELDNLPPHLQQRIAQLFEHAESPHIISTNDNPAAVESGANESTAQSSSQVGRSAGLPTSTMPTSTMPTSTKRTETSRLATEEKVAVGSRSGDRMREVIAWLCAAAALFIALLAWLDRGQRGDSLVAQPSPLTNAEKMARMLDSGDPIRNIAWTVNDDQWVAANQTSVEGRIVWSDEKQEGYMTFQGLAANDPDTSCYQLWIFDKAQSEAFPVNGGVFNIESTDDETVVRVDAELIVQEAYLFAVTVEKPPGVVVSDRSRLPLLAKVE